MKDWSKFGSSESNLISVKFSILVDVYAPIIEW